MSGRTNVPDAIVRLLSREANATDGLTINEIVTQTGLSRASVQRWLNRLPGISQSVRPVYPTGYWFDVGKAVAEAENKTERTVKPQTELGDYPGVNYFPLANYPPKVIYHIKAIEDAKNHVPKDLPELMLAMFAALGESFKNAHDFTSGRAELNREVYVTFHQRAVKVRRTLENYLHLIAAFQDAPETQTPEYFMAFINHLDTSNRETKEPVTNDDPE